MQPTMSLSSHAALMVGHPSGSHQQLVRPLTHSQTHVSISLTCTRSSLIGFISMSLHRMSIQHIWWHAAIAIHWNCLWTLRQVSRSIMLNFNENFDGDVYLIFRLSCLQAWSQPSHRPISGRPDPVVAEDPQHQHPIRMRMEKFRRTAPNPMDSLPMLNSVINSTNVGRSYHSPLFELRQNLTVLYSSLGNFSGGKITEKLCPDGKVFNDYSTEYEKCDLPFNIDCSKRSKLRK